MRPTTGRPALLALLALASGPLPGCASDDDRYFTPSGGYDPGDGTATPWPGGDGGDAGGADQPDRCAAGQAFCHDGARWRCGEDGLSATLVQDCTAAPYEGCAVGSCGTGEDPTTACCVSSRPFCSAEVAVEAKDEVDVDFAGLWDDDFACTGSLREDAYNWSLWARLAACEGRFVRVIVSGYREGVVPGQTYALCRTSSSVPAVHVTLMADASTYGNLDEACGSVTGTVTFHELGAEPGQPFQIEVDGTLLDASTGETRALRVTTAGLLASYE